MENQGLAAHPLGPLLHRCEPCVLDEQRRSVASLDGQNRAIVIAESLARVIAAIRIASVRWRSHLARKHRN